MDNKEILQRAEQYLKKEHNEYFRNEVKELYEKNNAGELRERFYSQLEFGTGGLRGIIGGGYTRMNPYTVSKATQGLANYLIKTIGGKELSVVIAYDSRNFSDLFSLEAAKVLCGNGIKTLIYSGIRPAPQLSFSVRYFNADAGIVITASHNPPEYNGYKVYWSDGGQIVPPHDKGIIEEAGNVKEIKRMDENSAKSSGLLQYVDEEPDRAFIETTKKLSLRPDLISEHGKEIEVVYTPLHGSGAVPVSRVLSELGISVTFVPEQEKPDGNFPTVKYPNPEEPDAMRMAVELAKERKAHLVMGTDPDADRIGVAVPDGDDYTLITGNQLGSLLMDYILSARSQNKTLPEKGVCIKTIVTTELQRKIAESYGVMCVDTLTGFKYIAEKIREFEEKREGYQFIFGGEESYGYLTGTDIRDKDAVSASLLTAEMTLYYLQKGMGLTEALESLYMKHGYYQEKLVTNRFPGEDGKIKMGAMMDDIRKKPPLKIGVEDVEAVKDYMSSTIEEIKSGRKKEMIGFPASNVLQFIMSEGSIITMRPSGTEPKIKLYVSSTDSIAEGLEKARGLVSERVSSVESFFNDLVGKYTGE